MLAHKGSEEGVLAADLIAGEVAELNYGVIPSVIYTAPEIAWVGKTEEEVKGGGRAYKTGSFPFAASGRAKAMEQPDGMVKIISAEDDDEILGVHIVGPMAGELISEAVLAMEFQASTEDLQEQFTLTPASQKQFMRRHLPLITRRSIIRTGSSCEQRQSSWLRSAAHSGYVRKLFETVDNAT